MRFPERGRGSRVGDVRSVAWRSDGDRTTDQCRNDRVSDGDASRRMAATNLASRGVGGGLPPVGMFLRRTMVKKEDDFEVRSPTGKDIAVAVTRLRKDGPEITGQYQNCVDGCERNTIRLFHLARHSDGAFAGFMGFDVHLEPMGEGYPPNAWISVEYVYLVPEFRGFGLSHHFLARALRRSKWWLKKMASEHASTGIVCRSGSCIASDEGERFCEQLDNELRSWCSKKRITFGS